MLITKLPLLNISRKIGKPLCLPVSYTFSVNSACDCNCRTCNISARPDNHMSIEEWTKVLDSIGTAPYWITVTGGNQFLRKDFGELLELMISRCRPKIVNIPVNGTMPDKIHEVVSRVVRHSCQVNINLSIDGIGEDHDRIRGREGNFSLLMETYEKLKSVQAKNLHIGFYTIVSRFNQDQLENILLLLDEMSIRRYGIEPAENRKELCNEKTKLHDIEPLGLHTQSGPAKGLRGKLRHNYHLATDKVLTEKREVIPCYAGLASIHISHDGEIWQCVTKADSMGSLRNNSYDFQKIFNSEKAARIREAIKKERCFCTHSNPSYTNQLCTPKALLKLI